MYKRLIIDIASTELTTDDYELLQHPAVAGVILFARNCEDPQQIQRLTAAIKKIMGEKTVIMVDQEGGRVQRLQQEFTPLSALGELGVASDPIAAARTHAKTMVNEVQQVGIDLSLAPVLDINGISDVIGKRSFGKTADQIIELASYYLQQMHTERMLTTGKHFPGHGSVAADTHIAVADDPRLFNEIEQNDLKIFSQLINKKLIDCMMPAHVIYSGCDSYPAGLSKFWLQTILKQQLGFNGWVISDDLSMQGIRAFGDLHSCTQEALTVGCDFVLACQDRQGVIQLIDQLTLTASTEQQNRINHFYHYLNHVI